MANGGSVIFKFEGDTKGIEKATGKTESAISTLAKSFTIAEVASKALSKSISLINQNLDSAISRYDTMNNFPRVMKNLGFETKDAEKAVETLSDGLQGLPTALDESISSVQRLTSANGDIEKSTQIYLAMNDAILAGGANAQTQASAMEQLTQAYSKGKFDAIEYRSVMSAMPGQLKQVAQYLGYTSTAIGGDLYNALQDGTLSMEQFMNAIIELDKKGSNGMSSFKEQALSATGGIATSFKNARTAIVRELTKVIGKIDDSLKAYGGISGVIKKVSQALIKIISKVGDFLVGVIKKIPTLISLLKKVKPIIEGIVAGLIAYKVTMIAIQAINVASMILGTVSAFLSLIPAIHSVKDAMILLNMTFSANPIGLVVAAVGALTVAAVSLFNAFANGTEEEKEQAEAMKELAKQSAETKKSYEDLREAQNKKITEGLGEINYTQQLANELRNLADSQGNVAEKDRARAQFILGELNKALGTEYQMIDGQIQKYNELSASIDEQLEKKRMQLLFEAREEEYRKALSEWTDLQTKKEQARIEVEKANAEFRENENRANAERLLSATENYNNLEEAIKTASENIRSYEDAYTANLQGNTEEAKRLLMDKSRAFTEYKDVANLSQEEQTRVLKDQLDKSVEYLTSYGENYKKGVEGYSSDGLAEAIRYAEEAKKEYEKVGKNINTGIVDGLNANSGRTFNVIGSIANGLLSRMTSILGIHSPSRVFRDLIGKNIALGIEVGFEDEMTSVQKSMGNIMAGLGNMFDLSPTLNNTTTSSANVTVQVYNNMETDFMGNLVNNIKSFSNGSKNDYNYGMT